MFKRLQRRGSKEIHTRVSLRHQWVNIRVFQYCSSIPELRIPCIHPYIFYSKDLLAYPYNPRPNQQPTKSVYIYKQENGNWLCNWSLSIIIFPGKSSGRTCTLLLRRNKGHCTNLRLPVLLGQESNSISLRAQKSWRIYSYTDTLTTKHKMNGKHIFQCL